MPTDIADMAGAQASNLQHMENPYAAGLRAKEHERWEAIARRFHEEYEHLAPQLRYETRPESAVPWEDVPAQNKALMIATVKAVFEPAGWQEPACMGLNVYASPIYRTQKCPRHDEPWRQVFRLRAGSSHDGKVQDAPE